MSCCVSGPSSPTRLRIDRAAATMVTSIERKLSREGRLVATDAMSSADPQDGGPTVPEQHGGKWIAWNADGTRIIASGDDATQVRADAIATGEQEPILEKVPPSRSLSLVAHDPRCGPAAVVC